jgi:hypothetical protein
MNKMNKTILVITVLLLTFALLSIPVMGAPATKKSVTVTLDTIVSFTSSPLPNDHGIAKWEGSATGTVYLTIPGLGTLEGDYSGDFKGTVKFIQPSPPDPDAEAVLMGKLVLTFTEQFGHTGTFVGVRHTKFVGTAGVQSYVESHMVLHGTNDFEGQTLKLSYKGAPPLAFEGTLIIP